MTNTGLTPQVRALIRKQCLEELAYFHWNPDDFRGSVQYEDRNRITACCVLTHKSGDFFVEFANIYFNETGVMQRHGPYLDGLGAEFSHCHTFQGRVQGLPRS